MQTTRYVIAAVVFIAYSIPSYGGDGKIHRMPEPVAGQYLVTLENSVARADVPAVAQSLVSTHGGRVRAIMNHIVNLLSVDMTEAQATALASNPLVAAVEEVAEVHLSTIQTLPPPRVISVGGSGRQTINGVLQDVRWQCPMFAGELCATETCNGTNVPSYGSNFGNMVDIYAPAHHVESAYTQTTASYRPDTRPPNGLPGPYYDNDADYYTRKSGTSFAAPLVAGVVARILQANPTLSPSQVWTQLQSLAYHTPTPLDSAGVDRNHATTTNNLLLNWRYSSAQCTVEYP